ncbi:LOW QUALITY PROTEIN: G-type lectin S-receptor-like serine/threonine-protein kinase LECRK3 [Hibiscus syriacus]|uniref:LOW QUALITY PROTEIN: G-type lectin S-receptor-like serine/threonine-protein kinase LECRK3 n=1 Tax=Hibiscus syriacus TaxID=106335 RepID=UPI001922A309|nr:LOW QUALITY PROTEIN: G-type lectin S-receptor-like serine/threonine-protein kinase LECRK3 [Hibiscus syriacus]
MALVFFPLISLLLLLLVRTDAQTVGNLTVGASLSADENSHPWISPSGDYAFGFHQLSSDKSLFLLAIWYNKIPDRTLVWVNSYGILRLVTGLQVAVKRLNTLVHGHAEKEFKTEVNVIGQTHHKNLVRLLGFCDEGENRLLVYEYLSNGTLASFLFGGLRPSWIQRTQIAFGIARGLLYLHEECSTQIIHCDIKPQNILLDEYYNARISDFGLAKLLMLNQSQTNTYIRGTKGYVAPEWFRNLPISVKVDVYSFGVLLLELTCCRKSVDMESSSEERAILTDWAYDCYLEETLDLLVENDVDAQHDLAKVERFVQVAIWCIQEDLSLRPTMREVTQMLEGVVQVPAPPCPCPYASTA